MPRYQFLFPVTHLPAVRIDPAGFLEVAMELRRIDTQLLLPYVLCYLFKRWSLERAIPIRDR